MKNPLPIRKALAAALKMLCVLTGAGGFESAVGQPANCAPPPAGLVSWWPGENSTADAADGNPGAWAGFGNTNTYGPGVVGQAFVFDGTHRDRVNVGNPTSLQLQVFTIEAWVKRADATVSSFDIFGADGSVAGEGGEIFGYGRGGYLLGMLNDGHLFLTQVDLGGVFSAGVVADTNWHHVAVAKSETTAAFYIDGAPASAPVACTTTYYFDTAAAIGSRGDARGGTFFGTVDEPAVYNRALTASEVAAIYAAGSAGKCAPPPPPNCVAAPAGLVSWWRAETNALDAADSNHGTLAGNTTFGAGRVEQAFVFDGSGDAVPVGNPANLQLQDFTIEAWVKRASPTLASLGGGGVGNVFAYGSGGYALGLFDNGNLYLTQADVDHVATSSGITDTSFHHVAVSKAGTTVVFYIDGVACAERFYSTTFVFSTPAALGARGDNLANSFWGTIDEPAIYNRALTTNEIQALYNAGSAGKCAPTPPPPTNCVSAPAGMVSWWPGENSTADAVGGNTGTIAGTGTVSYGPGVVGQAFVFDGIHRDRVNVGNPINLQLEDFTLEAWVKRASPTVTSYDVLGADGSVAGDGACIFGYGRGGYILALANDGRMILSRTDIDGLFSTPLVTDTDWHHLAVTKSGTDAVFYVDGLPQATPAYVHPDPYTFDDATCTCTAAAAIGSRGDARGGTFFGMIDEPAVFNRALTATEVQAIYAAGTAGKCPPPSAPPVITSQPQDQTVAAGGTATFSVSAMGTPSPTYQWSHENDEIAGATAATLVLTDVQPAQAGNYSVVVSNVAGAVRSSNAVLTVLTYPPTITSQPTSLTVFEGKTASFSVLASGTAPLSYQWCFNGGALAGKTSTALTLGNVQFSQAGPYWAVVTNGYGAATSSTAILTVLPPPPCVTAPTGAVAWWRAESNTLDSVGINDAILHTNRPPNSSYTTGKVGVAFQTSPSAYSHVPASEELDVGAGAGFTVEGWIKPGSFPMPTQALVGWTDGKSFVGVGLALNNSTYAQAYLRDTNTRPVRNISFRSPASVFTNGVWTHLALAFDKPSGLATLYVNGASVAQTNLGVFRPQTTVPLYLGATIYNGFLANPFHGALDEFTIYNRALTPAEIQAIVAADEAGKCPPPRICTPPPSDLVAWWRGESNALDHVDGNHGAVTQVVAFPTGAVGRCFQFNGGYVRVPGDSNLNVGLCSGLTVEMWLKPVSTGTQPLVEWNSGTGTQGVHLATILTSALQANLLDTLGVSHTVTSPPLILRTGIWQHVALTYDKALGLATLYLNDNRVAQTNLGSFTPRTDLPLSFGYRPPGNYAGSGTKFSGGLDEISLYGRALTAAEIKGIVKARGEGKCKEPPAIVTQPANLRVNVGTDAQFSVGATGNPLLRYQWFKEGLPLPGATRTALALPAVQDADAGNYAVLITNWFGRVLSSNAVLRVNHPPVARIVVAPLAELPGLTNPVVIAPVCAAASVVLDGSQSSDGDADPLQFAWTEGTNWLAQGVTVTNHLAPGSHPITLQVSDGLLEDSATVTVDVLSPAQAVAVLADSVRAAPMSQRSTIPLLAILHAARGAFERCHALVGFHELLVFQHLVRVRVAPQDAALAEALRHGAQEIMDSLLLGGLGGPPHHRFPAWLRHEHGRMRMQFDAPQTGVYRVEASTNLVDWEMIGVAARRADGTFEFEDVNAARLPTRFYRIVAP